MLNECIDLIKQFIQNQPVHFHVIFEQNTLSNKNNLAYYTKHIIFVLFWGLISFHIMVSKNCNLTELQFKSKVDFKEILEKYVFEFYFHPILNMYKMLDLNNPLKLLNGNGNATKNCACIEILHFSIFCHEKRVLEFILKLLQNSKLFLKNDTFKNKLYNTFIFQFLYDLILLDLKYGKSKVIFTCWDLVLKILKQLFMDIKVDKTCNYF